MTTQRVGQLGALADQGLANLQHHPLCLLIGGLGHHKAHTRAETRAFVCSDPQRTALEILTWYARRWAVEVSFEETRRHLGVETQRQWSDPAIQRTTPLLLGLFSLVTLWASELAERTGRLPVLGAAWYKNPDPTFSDGLAAVRQTLWAEEAVRPILWRDDFPTWRSRPRTAEKPRPLQQRLTELMSYAA